MTGCMEQQIEELKEVFVDQISENPHQPRRHFSLEELEELAESIKEVGLIHPPLVRPLEEEGRYALVSGERRFRAVQLAGFKKIKVLVRDSSQILSAQQALIENMHRVDLNPLEIAQGLRRLMDEFGLHQDQLALKVGKKRSTVANYLRLLGLPKNIQESVGQGLISMGHAKVILSITDFEKQNLLFELILRDDLTVREAEVAARRIQEKAKKRVLVHVNRDFFLEQLAEKIQHQLGTKVSLTGKGKKGRIMIDYYNFDDLDRLLAIFGVSVH